MKKLIYGVGGAVLAVCGVAASKPAATTTYFWQYTAAGTNLIIPTTPPPTTNITGCGGVVAPNCSLSATAYSTAQSGGKTFYSPSAAATQALFQHDL